VGRDVTSRRVGMPGRCERLHNTVEECGTEPE